MFNTQKPDTRQSFYADPIRWTALVIGLVAFCVSIVMSRDWQIYNGQAELMAWAVAFSFVGFTNLIFEVGYGLFVKARRAKLVIHRIVKEDQKSGKKVIRLRYFGGVICILIASLLECYNMMSIIGAQYNALLVSKIGVPEIQLTQTSDSVEAKRKLWQETKDTAITNNKKLDVDLLQGVLDYKKVVKLDFADLNPSELAVNPVTKVYNDRQQDLKNKKNVNDASIANANAELLKLVDAKEAAKNISKSNQTLFHGTIYTYLNTVTNIDELRLQFFFTALPSLFLGLISGLSFAFFLYGKNESKEVQK